MFCTFAQEQERERVNAKQGAAHQGLIVVDIESILSGLQTAFAEWYPNRPVNIVDSPGRETKDMMRRLEGLTWRGLLVTQDLALEPMFLSQEAWLYYLPAFLMMDRRSEGLIGYDLEVLCLPPGLHPHLEPVSIETLLGRLDANQIRATKNLVALHCDLSSTRNSSEPPYACHTWSSCWRDL